RPRARQHQAPTALDHGSHTQRAEERPLHHGHPRLGPEECVAEADQSRVPHRVMSGVGHRPVGPKPRVAVPLCDALRHHMVESTIGGGGHETSAPKGGQEAHPEGYEEDERRHAPGPTIPIRARSTTTSESGSPTTPVYDPSMRSTKTAPSP